MIAFDHQISTQFLSDLLDRSLQGRGSRAAPDLRRGAIQMFCWLTVSGNLTPLFGSSSRTIIHRRKKKTKPWFTDQACSLSPETTTAHSAIFQIQKRSISAGAHLQLQLRRVRCEPAPDGNQGNPKNMRHLFSFIDLNTANFRTNQR